MVLLIFFIAGIIIWYRFGSNSQLFNKHYATVFFFAYSVFYIVLGHFKKGFFYGAHRRQLEQYLYWVIFAVIFVIWLLRGRKDSSVLFISKTSENWQRWLVVLPGVLIFIAIMALVSINSHNGLSGAQERF